MANVFKKIGSEITGAIKNPKNVLQKGLNVGTAAGAGLLTGGGYGAAAAALAEAIRQSQKGDVTTNLRNLGQSGLVGGGTGLMAGGTAGLLSGGTQGGYGGVLAQTIKDVGLKAALGSTAALPLKAAAAGTAYGLVKENKRKEEQKAKAFANEQQAKKDEANANLDDIIAGITGPSTPNAPISTQPYNPTMNYGVPQQNVYVDESGNVVGGGINTAAGEAGKSAAQILAEADLARRYREETLGKTKEAQAASVEELQRILNEEAATKYQRELPALYEDLNTRGLLLSSELGTQMSKRQQESAQDIATEIAKARLGYDIGNIGELKDISEGYLGGRGSALQREMSLEDYARQLAAAKQLGAATTPTTPYQGGSKLNTTTTLGGAQIGAQTGGASGALAGGTIGALAGK